ncbi:FMN-binding negative transcriptional regulator [Leptospira sp. 2 VSF19]|uniref:FMN-binding negative transcriptional regulator n=1 Tax=Leptospira soteropolitanensis TaxID=2950025 RepID=A0AAW5VK24_9LEPT|nr:FMN-binding negative transcriptional regulator [Leptospira soteropolitanensis]MCW7491896.1 FMN-binding negative transcriptional regulator [Leptospira soteropolitanensis]MCW7499480.1 FMN-binding negative transcriptional regulator [Leptospira soteropolitanensis]MCW7520929.1 FMN-binding negative transcriptional regulator [Leptospira soteropolitanensis]MCW7525584.1 FMN-binding negative transcriptional regulator [Leptospira soteropolitanensis]MCW7529450.1 FMN-binding negative transcriptional reg
MYIPEHFQMETHFIYQSIEENPFSILVSESKSGMEATHLPLLLSDDKQSLVGHFAKPNPQKESVGKEVLCIFSGPHCYISPAWYETDRAVPTWNFTAVHVKGILNIVDDPEKIQKSLITLVNRFEPKDSKYQINSVDTNYTEGLKKGIVPFEIKITHIEGKQKLSQNHSIERRNLVIANLNSMSGENEKAIASLMRKSLNQ